jgi:hypothetical protein
MHSLPIHPAAGSAARHPEEAPGEALELERGAPFCANPACALHVRLVGSGAGGGGNWVTLADGRTFGRRRSGHWLLCDACATRRGPVIIAPASVTR